VGVKTLGSLTFNQIDLEVGTIKNCETGVYLLEGKDSIFDIQTTHFYPGVGNIGIVYNPLAYTYSDSPTIRNNKHDGTGNFLSGFDFSRSDGRDCEINIINNTNYENKTPHGYLNLLNNSTPTTVGNNVWTKLNFTGTTTYQNSIIFTGNRFTYLPDNKRDLMVWGSGTITTSSSQANIELVIVKNGDTGLLTAPTSITLDQNGRKFQWSANGYLYGVNANDFFEIWGRGIGNEETIIVEDFNWLIKST
jgi:hypothetical protein